MATEEKTRQGQEDNKERTTNRRDSQQYTAFCATGHVHKSFREAYQSSYDFGIWPGGSWDTREKEKSPRVYTARKESLVSPGRTAGWEN